MARTIAQLMEKALEVKEAVLVNENTALRVGGLFADIVTYLEDFCDNDIAALRLRQDAIDDVVANNYDTFLSFRNSVNGELAAIDADIRDKYADYFTWKEQTSTYITQYATAYDSSGHLVRMSQLLQTAEFAGMFVSALDENGVITSANISTYIDSFVDANDVEQLISVAEITADKIKFNVTFDWVVTSGSQTVFRLDNNGNLTVAGDITLGTTTLPSRATRGWATATYIEDGEIWVGGNYWDEASGGGSIGIVRQSSFTVDPTAEYLATISATHVLPTVQNKALKVIGNSYFDGNVTIDGSLTVTEETTVPFPVKTSSFTLPENASIGSIVFNPNGNNVTAPTGETIVNESSSSSSHTASQGYAYFYLKMSSTQWKVYNCH